MREILFRAKRKDNGDWIYGDLLQNIDCYKIREREKDITRIAKSYEVIPETVGQYIGLKDINGKKIFDGDIVKGFQYPYLSDGEYNYYAEVCWFDNCPAFGLYTFKAPDAKVRGISEGNTDIIEDFASEDWEVIGNIHDNKELLKDLMKKELKEKEE